MKSLKVPQIILGMFLGLSGMLEARDLPTRESGVEVVRSEDPSNKHNDLNVHPRRRGTIAGHEAPIVKGSSSGSSPRRGSVGSKPTKSDQIIKPSRDIDGSDKYEEKDLGKNLEGQFEVHLDVHPDFIETSEVTVRKQKAEKLAQDLKDLTSLSHALVRSDPEKYQPIVTTELLLRQNFNEIKNNLHKLDEEEFDNIFFVFDTYRQAILDIAITAKATKSISDMDKSKLAVMYDELQGFKEDLEEAGKDIKKENEAYTAFEKGVGETNIVDFDSKPAVFSVESQYEDLVKMNDFQSLPEDVQGKVDQLYKNYKQLQSEDTGSLGKDISVVFKKIEDAVAAHEKNENDKIEIPDEVTRTIDELVEKQTGFLKQKASFTKGVMEDIQDIENATTSMKASLESFATGFMARFKNARDSLQLTTYKVTQAIKLEVRDLKDIASKKRFGDGLKSKLTNLSQRLKNAKTQFTIVVEGIKLKIRTGTKASDETELSMLETFLSPIKKMFVPEEDRISDDDMNWLLSQAMSRDKDGKLIDSAVHNPSNEELAKALDGSLNSTREEEALIAPVKPVQDKTDAELEKAALYKDTFEQVTDIADGKPAVMRSLRSFASKVVEFAKSKTPSLKINSNSIVGKALKRAKELKRGASMVDFVRGVKEKMGDLARILKIQRTPKVENPYDRPTGITKAPDVQVSYDEGDEDDDSGPVIVIEAPTEKPVRMSLLEVVAGPVKEAFTKFFQKMSSLKKGDGMTKVQRKYQKDFANDLRSALKNFERAQDTNEEGASDDNEEGEKWYDDFDDLTIEEKKDLADLNNKYSEGPTYTADEYLANKKLSEAFMKAHPNLTFKIGRGGKLQITQKVFADDGTEYGDDKPASVANKPPLPDGREDALARFKAEKAGIVETTSTSSIPKAPPLPDDLLRGSTTSPVTSAQPVTAAAKPVASTVAPGRASLLDEIAKRPALNPAGDRVLGSKQTKVETSEDDVATAMEKRRASLGDKDDEEDTDNENWD